MAYVLTSTEVFRISDVTDANGRRVITYEYREFYVQASPPDSYWFTPPTANVQLISAVSGPALGNSFYPFCPLRPTANLQPLSGGYTGVPNPVTMVACAPGAVRVQFPTASVNGIWPETVDAIGPIVTDAFEVVEVPMSEDVGRLRALPEFELLGEGATPVIPPVISNVQPAAGVIDRNTPISFETTDELDSFKRILIMVEFPDSQIKEVAFDGEGFGPKYQNINNTQTSITNGFSFTLLRDGGWPDSSGPILTPFVIDTTGGENA